MFISNAYAEAAAAAPDNGFMNFLPLFALIQWRGRSPLLDLQMNPGNLSFYMFSAKARILAG